MNQTKHFWVRAVYSDKPCHDTKPVKRRQSASAELRQLMALDLDIRYAYVMTTDPWGECFLQLIRRDEL